MSASYESAKDHDLLAGRNCAMFMSVPLLLRLVVPRLSITNTRAAFKNTAAQISLQTSKSESLGL